MAGYRILIDQDSVARFEKAGRGKGTGKEYLPWLRVQDVSSKGLSTRVEGWKTGRIHHFLSQLESTYYYVLEWSRIVLDIREQYPLLPLEETISIAQSCGIKHPVHPKTEKPVVFTTDFLLTVSLDGKTVTHARTVKYAKALDSVQTLKKLEIERRFWEARGIDWGIVTELDIPAELSQNVNDLHEAWYLATYMPSSDLARIVPVLTDLVQQNKQQPLRKVTTSCDLQLGYEEGTSLKVAYYLIATRQWIIDMFRALDPGEPLDLLQVADCH
jgi:hypothetical protein